MKYYKTEQEAQKMRSTILDTETGMTELDAWEMMHPYDELIVN